MKLDASGVKRSLNQFATIAKRERVDVVHMMAKGFVRDMIAVTPPGSAGVTGTAAKKQGEAAIDRDLSRIMVVSAKPDNAVDPLALHKQQFQAGRIHALRPKAQVDAAKYRALQALLKARVGFLASGWNKMGERLQVNIPHWVKRHGFKAGTVKVIETKTRFRIEGVNETAYVGNVKDYLRRIDTVVQYQARKLDRQCVAILKKLGRQSGFK